jgi:hypothetical protein
LRYLCFCFLLTAHVLYAQTQLTDSLRLCLLKKPGPDFSLDSRDSFIANRSARTYGVRIGVDFGGSLKMGGGYYQLGSPIIRIEPFHNSSGNTNVRSTIYLHYICYYIEYVFYNSRSWKFSALPQVGFGFTSKDFVYNDVVQRGKKKPAFMYEPCLSGEYKLTRWLGIGASAGFRLMLKDNKSVKENFNAPIYSFSVMIHWDKLYGYFFPNSAWMKKYK